MSDPVKPETAPKVDDSWWDAKPGRLRGELTDCPAQGEAGRTITDADGRFAGSGRNITEALKAFMQAAVDAGVGRGGETVDVVLRYPNGEQV